MSEVNSNSWSDLFTMAFAGLAPGISQLHITITTHSGREFKYEISEYPISPETTPESALVLARRIFRDKYRFSEWDQRHPHVNVEQEIIAKLVELILEQVPKIQQYLARHPRRATHLPRPGGPTIETFPSPGVKLLALKAMRAGREVDTKGHQTEVKAFVEMCLANLDKLPGSQGVLGWKQFYLLVLAELFRSSDPVPYRSDASELGEAMGNQATNLLPWYMKMVQATDRTPTSGNFGDFKTAPNSKFDNSGYIHDRDGHTVRVGTAEEAVGLTDWELSRNREFLGMGLYEITKSLGLVAW
jgi:hypothetical protein